MNEAELLQLLDLGEGLDVEFKSGKGGFPKDAWCTISAFANTDGGYLVLGVTEKKHNSYEVQGINKPAALQKAFWDNHNNGQKISTPVCNDADLSLLEVNGRQVLVLYVASADRARRPVYINSNPITGTYKRNFEGDYRCTESEVRQMLRDAAPDPQDALILDDFDLTDLDPETIKAFRNRFASREPDHPFLGLEDKGLLERLGGWRRERRIGKEGLTLAGLLMFGRERSLLDALPHYHLDYQEKISSDSDERWTYRLTLDGKWEPNLFNFYFRVYPRLVESLSLPFKLDKDAVRQGETHVHEAMREVLVNSLIHADHQSARAITILKLPDAFIFTNPGRLRIPRNVLYQGGVTDPRNPNLQKMFQMLGLGEKAGSGFQKILRAWREQHWMMPLVSEHPVLEMTRVWLSLASMIPKSVEEALRAVVGGTYDSLKELDRVILMLTHRYGEIANSDVQPYSKKHPKEIGDRLKSLVLKGWLEKSGSGRGTRYNLSGDTKPTLPLFDPQIIQTLQAPQRPNSEHYASNMAQMTSNSEHYASNMAQKTSNSEHYASNMAQKTSNSEHYASNAAHDMEKMVEIAAPIRKKGRASKELVRNTILELCAEQFLLLQTFSTLLARSTDTIRTHYLIPMVREGLLELKYPEQLNHPKQAYKATGEKNI